MSFSWWRGFRPVLLVLGFVAVLGCRTRQDTREQNSGLGEAFEALQKELKRIGGTVINLTTYEKRGSAVWSALSMNTFHRGISLPSSAPTVSAVVPNSKRREVRNPEGTLAGSRLYLVKPFRLS
jgi:hypothetical protein